MNLYVRVLYAKTQIRGKLAAGRIRVDKVNDIFLIIGINISDKI